MTGVSSGQADALSGGGFSFSDSDWRLSLRDWDSQVSSSEMDVGSAVTPKICDQVLTMCADEAGVASHCGTDGTSTSR